MNDSLRSARGHLKSAGLYFRRYEEGLISPDSAALGYRAAQTANAELDNGESTSW